MSQDPSESPPHGGLNRPLHILEVETFGRGGLIHYAYNLSCALAERGHQVTLVTTASYELEDRPLPANVRVVKAIARSTPRLGKRWPAPLASLARKIETLVDAWRVTALAHRLRPDILHIHCTNPASLVYHLLFRLLPMPLVATAHVVTPHERIPLHQVIYRSIHRSSQLTIAHSDFDRQRLLEEFAVDPRRAVVIPHGEYGFFERSDHRDHPGDKDHPEARDGATARRSFGLAAQHEVVLFFGYIREYKGLDLLLEAWPVVLTARPQARLLVAGDPVQLSAARRTELEAWATKLGAVHRFEYIPFSEVPRYFAAADLLVMPYRHISQSGVLFLALSLGLPVIATRVGALPEMLRDGDNALLVPPLATAPLAQALIRLLGDPALRDRLVRGGRKVADQHSWPAIAERTEAAFFDLLDR